MYLIKGKYSILNEAVIAAQKIILVKIMAKAVRIIRCAYIMLSKVQSVQVLQFAASTRKLLNEV